jgi:hypothetical protein
VLALYACWRRRRAGDGRLLRLEARCTGKLLVLSATLLPSASQQQPG